MNGSKKPLKYNTPKKRKDVHKKWCEHLASGKPQDLFPECDEETIKKYIREFPEDCPIDDVNRAKRIGKLKIYEIGFAGTVGKLVGFNAKSWQFIMNNMLGWSDKREQELYGKDGAPLSINIVDYKK